MNFIFEGLAGLNRDRLAQIAVGILNNIGRNEDMALIVLPETEKKMVT